MSSLSYATIYTIFRKEYESFKNIQVIYKIPYKVVTLKHPEYEEIFTTRIAFCRILSLFNNYGLTVTKEEYANELNAVPMIRINDNLFISYEPENYKFYILWFILLKFSIKEIKKQFYIS